MLIKYLKLMRFHKPIGIWLLLSPALWALWIAGQGRPHLENVMIFIVGSIVMRAAGCVINDIADRNIDPFVARTKNRPLASGEVSVRQALVLFLILIMLAGVLVVQLNITAIFLGIIALFLACLYPFTKRVLSFPQLFLSLAFGMSIPMAFAAELNHLMNLKSVLICILIYIINFLWVIMYDTEYAMVDRADDLKIKIKSTAILFGKYDVLIICLLQALIIFLLNLLGWILKLNFIYDIFINMNIILFLYQINLIFYRDPEKCLKAFLNNQWVGLMIFLGLFIPHAGFYWQGLMH